MSITTFLVLAGLTVGMTALAQLETDTIPTSGGDLKITFVGHASLMFTFNNRVIQVDPYGKLTDYAKLAKADLILVTHDHFDHFDAAAIRSIQTTNTTVILSAICANRLGIGQVMKAGDELKVQGIKIQAVPAYNLLHKRPDGQPFHPKGEGNGYILTFGDKRIYVAGDTENTPEMKALKGIDIAFLPMNLPYTMTPEMVADAAQAFKPKILYPYHYGDTDPLKLKALLKAMPEIDVRIRQLK